MPPHRGQAFGDELAAEVDIGAVFERDDHLREAELRDRAHHLQAWQTAQRLFDGKRDPLFDFLRAQRRGHGVDLHLHGRGVGEGVDVEIAQRHPAGNREHGGCRDHQKAVPQREIDNSVEHVFFRDAISCRPWTVSPAHSRRSLRRDCS